jgi:hypothetical protein
VIGGQGGVQHLSRRGERAAMTADGVDLPRPRVF